MTSQADPQRKERILLLAPTGRDAPLAESALQRAGIGCTICADMETLCRETEAGAGAVMMTEEALTGPAMHCLREVLEREPPWADLPLLIFVTRPSAELTVRSFEALGPRANVTLIERPIRVKTLISAAHAALRARRRQYEVRDLVHELEKRVEERDNFLAMLSHELRNPLAAITLAVDALDASTSEREIVVRQTRHLRKLVDDLLDIGRVTSGKIILHRTQADFADIVDHCLTTMRGQIEARHLQVAVHPPAEHVWVHGDTVRLEQIVNNLLSNAIKYTPPGGSIEVRVDREQAEVVLRVRDSGKGIPPEILTRIFDLFMQGDVSIDRSDGGMGIGLTLVRRLTELHGGSVRAYSRGPGGGSEFVVRLPLAHPATAPAPSPEGRRARKDAPRNIVVIEDNADVRELLRIKLRQLGHRVMTAEDGVTGLQIVLGEKPDVALIDIGLPGMDGYELARLVRQALGDTVYLVALTGYGQTDDRKRALEAGFNVHLTKPAELVDLQNVVARAGLE